MLSRDKIKLGIAPIAWAEDDMPEYGKETNFLQIISEIKLTGYEGTEVGCKFPSDPREVKKELDRRDLGCITKWYSSYINEQPLWAVARDFKDHCLFLKAAGADRAVVSDQSFSVQHRANTAYTDKYVLNDEQMKELGDGLNELGKIANSLGVKLLFHHHMTTTIQTAEEIDRLMAVTEKGLVYLLLDTGHLTFSGDDPVEVIKKHHDRIAHYHLKNVRKDVADRCKAEGRSFLDSVLEGAFTVPGDETGCVDFPTVFKLIEETGYEGWVVVEAEQNPYIYNAYDYAVLARNYVREQTGL
ncbi:MAG: myo-inosose-2 dehydratase [Clostridiales Family XIII bacterium]|nr:myo-inosose-2 dehydratase [Clostridiales Family XIII bacterium]